MDPFILRTMAGFGVVARSTQAQSVRQAAGIRESVRTPVPLIMALQWHDAPFRTVIMILLSVQIIVHTSVS